MLTRKLVKSGASSYTIALPKKWLDQNNLDKGDLVFIKERSHTELTLSTDSKVDPASNREITINVDDKEVPTIDREVTSAYIRNFDTIMLIGDSIVDKTAEIRRVLGNFTALEITEQTATKIVAKDLANLKEVSIDSSLRRMDMLIRSMLEDLAKSTQKGVAETLNYRDYDVNKLYFLMFRLVRGALDNPALASFFSIGNNRALSVWYLSMNLEGMADAIKNVSTSLIALGDSFDFAELEIVYPGIRQAYLDVIKAYHKKDKASADTVLSLRRGLIEQVLNFSKKKSKYEILEICWNLREMIDTICNIARIVIDESS